MDGFTTAENIRQNADFSASKIVMLTSAGSRGDGDRCRRLGIQVTAQTSQILGTFQCHRGSAGNQGGGERASRDPALAPRVMQESQILVAEDNRVNQKLASRLLEKNGPFCSDRQQWARSSGHFSIKAYLILF